MPTPTLIICGDEDDDCIEPSLFLKKQSRRPGWHLSESRPCAQSGGAGAVQRDGGSLHRAGRSRPLAGARSAVDGGGSRPEKAFLNAIISDEAENRMGDSWLEAGKNRSDDEITAPCRHG